MQLEDHRELVVVLTELWTLFERLANCSASLLQQMRMH